MSELPSYLTEGLDQTQAIPTVPPPTTPTPSPAPALTQPLRQRGWFRRNLWGLLTVVPLAIALGAVGVYNGNGYERFWKHEPRQPIAAAAGDWVSYSQARLRLNGFTEATTLPGYGSTTVTPPKGMRVWQATLDFDVPKQESLYGCKLLLEDDKGRLYSAGPDELNDTFARIPIASCTFLDDETLNRYQTVAFFVTPTDARPVALRVEQSLSFPRYARLSLPS